MSKTWTVSSVSTAQLPGGNRKRTSFISHGKIGWIKGIAHQKLKLFYFLNPMQFQTYMIVSLPLNWKEYFNIRNRICFTNGSFDQFIRIPIHWKDPTQKKNLFTLSLLQWTDWSSSQKMIHSWNDETDLVLKFSLLVLNHKHISLKEQVIHKCFLILNLGFLAGFH